MSIDHNAVVDEVLAGLRNERERLSDALYNREFYEGHFERFPVRQIAGYEDFRYQRHSRFMGWVCDALTANLYREGPHRQLSQHPRASEWLNQIYRKWWIDAAWQDADRMATWGGYCAWQVFGTDDPLKPVSYYLWGADELVVWLDEDDPLKAAAVATIDCRDAQRRLRLWTADTLTTFTTKKWNGETADYTAFQLVSEEPNVYGVIPFAFVHWRQPTSRFERSGPGDHLRRVNDWLNFTLTETGDSIRYSIRPVLAAYNTVAPFAPPRPIRPGSIWEVPSGADATGSGPEPRLEYLQADPGFISTTWEDLGEFLGHTLETFRIPRAAFRLEQSAARSGISIVAEQLPLLDWAQSRQRPYGRYEEDLARLTLTVAARHLANNGLIRGDLEEAAADPGLSLRWGRMWANLPGPARDQSDEWRYSMNLCSTIDLLCERDGLTRDEATDRLEQIAEDRKLEAELLGATPAPSSSQPPRPDEPIENDETFDDGESDETGSESDEL